MMDCEHAIVDIFCTSYISGGILNWCNITIHKH